MDLDVSLDEEMMDYDDTIEEGDAIMRTPLLDAAAADESVQIMETDIGESADADADDDADADEGMAEGIVEDEEDEDAVEEIGNDDAELAPAGTPAAAAAAEGATVEMEIRTSPAPAPVPDVAAIQTVTILEAVPGGTPAATSPPPVVTLTAVDPETEEPRDKMDEEIEYDAGTTDIEDGAAGTRQAVGVEHAEEHDPEAPDSGLGEETQQRPTKAEDTKHREGSPAEQHDATDCAAEGEGEEEAEEYYEDEELPPLAPILVHVPDLGTRALFTAVEEEDGAPAPKLPVYLAGRDELAEEGLQSLITALREELAKDGVMISGECVLVEKMMDLKMGEDDVNLQSVTLLDLLTLHEGCGLPTPVQLFVTDVPHRFITRFEAIQREVAAAEARESARNSLGAEDQEREQAAGEGEVEGGDEGDEGGEEDEYEYGDDEYYDGEEDEYPEGEEEYPEGEEEYPEGEEEYPPGEDGEGGEGGEVEHHREVVVDAEEQHHDGEDASAAVAAEAEAVTVPETEAEAAPQPEPAPDTTHGTEPDMSAAVEAGTQAAEPRPTEATGEADTTAASGEQAPEAVAEDEAGEEHEHDNSDALGIEAVSEAAVAESAEDPGAEDEEISPSGDRLATIPEAEAEPESEIQAQDADEDAGAGDDVAGGDEGDEDAEDAEDADEYGIEGIAEQALAASADDTEVAASQEPAAAPTDEPTRQPSDEPPADGGSTALPQDVEADGVSLESTIAGDEEYVPDEEEYDGEGEIEGPGPQAGVEFEEEAEYDEEEGTYDEGEEEEYPEGEGEYPEEEGEYDEPAAEYDEEEAVPEAADDEGAAADGSAVPVAPIRSPTKRSRELDETDEDGKGKVPRLEP